MVAAINIKALFTVYLLVNQWLLTPEDLAAIKHHVLSLGQHHLVHQTYIINVVWDSCDPHWTVQVHISPYQQRSFVDYDPDEGLGRWGVALEEE